MRVLGISGSLRRDSHNTKVLRAAGAMFESDGVELEVFDGLKLVPPYDEDDERAPHGEDDERARYREDDQRAQHDAVDERMSHHEDDERDRAAAAVEHLRHAVAGADAVFFSTPEYNSSVPGQLKNAIDWLSRPVGSGALENKPVAVVGASTGMFGAVWAQAELRKALAAAGARVVEGEVPVGHAHTRFDERGRLTDPVIAEQLREVVETLIAEADAPREVVAA